MRYLVLMILLLAVLLSLTQPAALQTAAVSSDHTIPVTTTDAALLALAPGALPANAAGIAYTDPGGNLLLDFRKGFGGGAYGFVHRNAAALQPLPDQYRFKGLFRVTNRSADRQCVRVFVPQVFSAAQPTDLAGIYIRPEGAAYGASSTQVAGLAGAPSGSPPASGCYTANPGQGLEVDFWFEITATAPVLPTFSVRVEGIRVP